MKKHIILIAIIIATLTISGSIIISQAMKQSSIEKQQRLKQSFEEKKEEDKKLQETLRQIDLDFCISNAEDSYWDYMELNGTGKRDDKRGVTAATYIWDRAKEDRAKEIDNCYRRYSND